MSRRITRPLIIAIALALLLNTLVLAAPLRPIPIVKPIGPPINMTGDIRTLTLQHGVNGYAGTQDVGLVSWFPNTTFSGINHDTMEVRTDDQLAGLIRFDLSGLPADAQVVGATLSLYAPWRHGPADRNLTVGAYKVLRPWLDAQATWNQARTGSSWGRPGCNQIGVDRAGEPESQIVIRGIWRWYDLSITQMVQEWIVDPGANHGVALKAYGVAAGVKFVTMEHGGIWMRPTLTIRYTVPEGTPSPTATPTDTATPSTSPTPTATTVPTRETVRLQHGVDGYAGTRDVGLVSWLPDTVFSGVNHDTLEVRTDDQLAGLMRFDLASVPPTATIHRATLQLYVPERYGPRAITVGAYKVLRPWIDAQATWNQAKTATTWGQPGCNAIATDREGVAVDQVTMYDTWRWYDLDITRLAADWVSDPSSNYGLALKAYGNAAGVKIVTMEHGGVWMRPVLVVEYSS